MCGRPVALTDAPVSARSCDTVMRVIVVVVYGANGTVGSSGTVGSCGLGVVAGGIVVLSPLVRWCSRNWT